MYYNVQIIQHALVSAFLATDLQYPDTHQQVLSHVSLQIEAGEVVALVGPSGSGKSSLLRVLLGFNQPDSGTVMFAGKQGTAVDIINARRYMGAVLQDEWLPTATIRSHISGMSPHDLDKVWDVAQRVGLENDIKRWPMGMQTLVDSLKLSSAQVQRIQIARALLHRPKILFLDEATSGLDETSQVSIVNAIRHLGMTCVIISHRRDLTMLADRVFILDAGKLQSE